eukprot:jgi/Psemu1/184706/e_gw1.41.19.1
MASSVFRDFDEYDGVDVGHDNGTVPSVADLDRCSDKSGGDDGATGSSCSNGSYKYNDKCKYKYKYAFTPKFRGSTKNNPMCGICLPQWISILRNRWRQIEWTVYWPRILFISVMSVLNSAMGLLDHLIYGKRVEEVEIDPRPVFVLGHPRTGTTLVHSLLALDSEQFSYCSTFCAGFPSCFLWFESIGKVLFKGVIDDTRPMDNVKLHFDLPQEDELATNVMSAGTSPYMPLFFMQQEPEFRPFYAFDDGQDSGTSSNNSSSSDDLSGDRRNGRRRRLILKSPVHTARIALLNQLFPEAQFIYIHRNPYDVFRSAAHMADTTYWYTYLNTPSDEQITEFILRQYEILEEPKRQQQQQQQQQSPRRRLVEISYEDISQRPIETAEHIYQQLGWDWTPRYRDRLASELAGHDYKTYKKNKHKPLDPSLKRVINERWGPSFERFGYTKE